MKDLEVLSSKCNEDPTYFLSNRDKLKLLLSSNEILENIQLNLNDLNVLKQHLDFDPFIEIKEKNEIIMSLMENLKKNSQDFEGKNTRLNDLLTNNEGIITQINKKILYLDSILSVLEIKEKPIKS